MQRHNTLAIYTPYDRVVSASTLAPKDKYARSIPKGIYTCVDAECRQPVMPKQGKMRKWHFAHYSSSASRMCPGNNGGEAIRHRICKEWVSVNFSNVTFETKVCSLCCKAIRKTFSDEEYRCKGVECKIDGTSRIADVLLVSKIMDPPVKIAIEIKDTHQVPLDKIIECEKAGVKVMEILSEDIQKIMTMKGSIFWDGPIRHVVRTTHDLVCTYYGMQLLCKKCRLEPLARC